MSYALPWVAMNERKWLNYHKLSGIASICYMYRIYVAYYYHSSLYKDIIDGMQTRNHGVRRLRTNTPMRGGRGPMSMTGSITLLSMHIYQGLPTWYSLYLG
jgi:hypothetical protein